MTADPQPAPPPGVLGMVSVGPLPRAFAGLTALGKTLGAWERSEDVFFAEIRALAEGVSDLAAALDWSRPAHVLVLDRQRLPGTVALLLPAKAPEKALAGLRKRCAGTGRAGLWSFTGGGAALLPCRFHVRAVPGGLVVAGHALLPDALARFGHAVLDPRMRPGRAPAAADGGPVQGATLVEARAFLPALRVRFDLTAAKVKQWVDLAAMGIAVAAGDFTAAGDLKEDLGRLVTQLDSLQDAGVALEIGADGVSLRLFATGLRGGALATWVRSRSPAPLGLHRRLEPGAAAALTVAGTGPAGDRAKKAPAAGRRSALGALVDLALPKLPEALRAPVKALAAALLGPDAGELSVALRHPCKGLLGLDLVMRHARPAEARKALFEAAKGLLTALQGGPGAKGSAPALALTVKSSPEADRIDLAPGGGVAGALAKLVGAPSLSVVIRHRGDAVALSFGADAETRSQTLLAESRSDGASAGAPPAAQGSPGAAPAGATGAAAAQETKGGGDAPPATKGGSGAPHRAPPHALAATATQGTLGRLALSLVELGRLVPGLLPEAPAREGDAGAMLLSWGLAPADRQVELRVTLPAAHLKALAPLWKALEARMEDSADAFSSLLGDDAAEDAL